MYNIIINTDHHNYVKWMHAKKTLEEYYEENHINFHDRSLGLWWMWSSCV